MTTPAQISPLPTPPNDPLAALARDAVARLQAAGHVAYWAGGCVRDLLLSRHPKDYDIATNALPDRVESLFPHSITVGKAFGVVRVPLADPSRRSQTEADAWFEIATFRQDHPYHDGRHPDGVTFADAPMDAARRDFTVNALFYDPVAAQVLDFVGGRADLQLRLIRAVGDPAARFREDHLRLMRAVRFAHTLEFAIEPRTAAAIRENAGLVTRVSAERIRDELTRIFVESRHPGTALKALDDLGLLAPILPEVAALKGQAQPPEYHPEGDVFTHVAMMLDRMNPPTAHLAFAILLHDIGKPPTATVDPTGRIRFNGHAEIGATMARAVLHRLKFSNDDTAAIVEAVQRHMHFMNVKHMKRSTLRTFVGRPNFDMELELHRIDCLSSNGMLDNHARVEEFRRELANEPILPPHWINGRDVMALGIPHGPHVGVWIQRAYEEQLEGRIPSREALLDWLREKIASDLTPDT